MKEQKEWKLVNMRITATMYCTIRYCLYYSASVAVLLVQNTLPCFAVYCVQQKPNTVAMTLTKIPLDVLSVSNDYNLH